MLIRRVALESRCYKIAFEEKDSNIFQKRLGTGNQIDMRLTSKALCSFVKGFRYKFQNQLRSLVLRAVRTCWTKRLDSLRPDVVGNLFYPLIFPLRMEATPYNSERRLTLFSMAVRSSSVRLCLYAAFADFKAVYTHFGK